MRMPSSESMHATICNRAIDRMVELARENAVLQRALELAIRFVYAVQGDGIPIISTPQELEQQLITQAEGELKGEPYAD